MSVREPRVRRRGFFLHSDTGESDIAEHDDAEGFVVRTRTPRTSTRQSTRVVASGRSRSGLTGEAEESRPAIRSGSVTGSRQRSHLPR